MKNHTKAEIIYDQQRSISCMVQIDAEMDIWKKGYVSGWLNEDVIVGFKDEDQPILEFNKKAGSIDLPNGSGQFCADNSGLKSYSLEDPNRIGRLYSIEEANGIFLCRNFVGCMSDIAPIALPAGHKVDHSCGAGWCPKYKVECFLHFNHSCVHNYDCKLSREEKKRKQAEEEKAAKMAAKKAEKKGGTQ